MISNNTFITFLMRNHSGTRFKAAGILLILTCVFDLSLFLVLGQITPGYSPMTQYVSELAVANSFNRDYRYRN
jgi:hypothetical protein